MNPKIRSFFCCIVPVIFWMVLIFMLSSVQGESIPKFPIPHFHMLVHFGEYAAFGFLVIRAFIHYVPAMRTEWLALFSVVLSLLFGLSDEWHQSFVAGRTNQLATVGFDVIFAVMGVGVYLILRKAWSKNKKSKLMME